MIRYLICSLLSVFCVIGCDPPKQATKSVSRIERAELDNAIRLAGDYLIRQVEEDGRFIYRINMNPDVRVPPKYNVLRHAGAIYALCLYAQTENVPQARQAISRACNFLIRETIKPIPEAHHALAIWSDPALWGGSEEAEAKLGGTGLGLVALIQARTIMLQPIEVPMLQSLGRFLLFMQYEDGNFISKYSIESGYDLEWQSLYYPGEAALGLVMLAEIDGNSQWREAAIRALLFLASERQGQPEVPPDHWALIATGRLLKLHEGSLDAKTRETLIAHAAQIASSMSRGVAADDAEDSDFDEASGRPLRSDGGTTPTSTRLEGLLAIWPYLECSLADQVERDIHDGIRFLLDSQVREGPYTGAIPRISPRVESDDRRATEVRIDYVQHALCAMLIYREHFGG